MAENSKIEWTDHTFNPWIGCTKVSPGCDHCYAARQDGFRRWTPEGWGGPRRRTSAQLWRDPVKWNAQPFCECMGCRWRGPAAKAGLKDCPPGFDRDPGVMLTCPSCQEPLLKEARARVFCSSLADVFDNEVPVNWRWDLFRLIAATPHLDWLLLTKRIGNARPMLNSAAAAVAGEFVDAPTWDLNPWPNVWLGATVVNQTEADRDVPKLLQVPARVRFLSIEPMLGPIDLREIVTRHDRLLTEAVDALRGELSCATDHGSGRVDRCDRLDWVICGGESGPGARPMRAAWAQSLRDQCAAAGVPFLFKQWGEFTTPKTAGVPVSALVGKDRVPGHAFDDGALVVRVGKMAAGRLLDGIEHKEFPDGTRS